MRVYMYAAVLVLLITYVTAALVTVDRRSAQVQIFSLLQEGAQAINDRDISKAMSYVSESYEDEFNKNYSQLRIRAAQALRDEARYHVTVSPRRITAREGSAAANCRVTVSRGTADKPFYSRDLVITLKQERGWHALVIPVRVWRITSIRNIGFNFAEEL